MHEFAADVMRPAAHEWDEREETPWPIIEEAARIGIYSFDFMANCLADPTGLLFPLINEELAWGDAGIALALLGSTLGVAAIVAAGTPEQVAEWAPRCFGQPGDVRLTALCVSEADAGSELGQRAYPGRVRRHERHLDDRGDQDLDHQWRYRRHPRRRGIGGARPRGAGPGELRRAREDAWALDGP